VLENEAQGTRPTAADRSGNIPALEAKCPFVEKATKSVDTKPPASMMASLPWSLSVTNTQ